MLTTPSYVFVYLYRQSCPPYLHSGDLQINASMEGWKGKIRKKVEVLLCLMSKWEIIKWNLLSGALIEFLFDFIAFISMDNASQKG